MKREAEDVVKQGTKTKQLTENRIAFMRCRGQGHEIVAINDQPLTSNSREVLMQTFESEYQRLFGGSAGLTENYDLVTNVKYK